MLHQTKQPEQPQFNYQNVALGKDSSISNGSQTQDIRTVTAIIV
jgi:hypothetical protein